MYVEERGTTLIGLAVAVTLLGLYVYPVPRLLELFIYLALAGILFNAAVIRGSPLEDMTWPILLSGGVTLGASLVAPIQLAQLVGLITLLVFVALYSGPFSDGLGDWPTESALLLAGAAILGVVVDNTWVVWIVLSPVIEAYLLAPVTMDKPETIGLALLYSALYVLSLQLPPALAIYTLAAIYMKTRSIRLRNIKYAPLDSLVRILVGVLPWIPG